MRIIINVLLDFHGRKSKRSLGICVLTRTPTTVKVTPHIEYSYDQYTGCF